MNSSTFAFVLNRVIATRAELRTNGAGKSKKQSLI